MTVEEAFSTRWAAASDRALACLADELSAADTELSQALDSVTADAFAPLLDRLARVKNVLLMIQKPATAWLAEEVTELVAAVGAGDLPARPDSDDLERARVLIHALDALDSAVAGLERVPGGDTALPWLDRINDMRSLRGKSFVSQALVLALDISADDELAQDPPEQALLAQWQERCRQFRPRFMRALIDWFRAVNQADEAARLQATAVVARQLQTLTDTAAMPAHDHRILRAAQLVASSLADGSSDDSGAVRRLFGLVERRLLAKPYAADPALLRDLLYYAALAGRSDLHRDEQLEQRYDLAAVRQAVAEAGIWCDAAPSISRRLHQGIYARALDRLPSIASWLEAGARLPDQRAWEQQAAHLRELDATLALLGDAEARAMLAALSEGIERLSPGTLVSEVQRVTMASQLLQLRHTLEANRARAGVVEPQATALVAASSTGATPIAREGRGLAERIQRIGQAETSVGDHEVEIARAAFLAEARHRLRNLEPAIDALMASDETRHASDVLRRLRGISKALAIVPLPEVSVLLEGCADAIEALTGVNADAERGAVARLIVDIGTCLEASSRTAEHLDEDVLGRAQESLSALEQLLPAKQWFGKSVVAEVSERESEQVQRSTQDRLAVSERVGDRVERDQRSLTHAALDALDDFGRALAAEAPDRLRLIEPLRTLERIGRRGGHAELSAVCGAALDHLETQPQVLPMAALSELQGVLPVLIADIATAGEVVDQRDLGVQDLVRAFAAPSAMSSNAGSAPSTIQTAAAAVPQAPSGLAIDEALQQVFVTEAHGHLRVIESELAADSRPGTRLLRALHTLEGSAQTVGAHAIVDIVQPLQHLAAERERENQPFSTQERVDVGAGLDAVSDALHDMSAVPAAWQGDRSALDTGSGGLAEVFAGEAEELIDRLRSLSTSAVADNPVRERALTTLHTLKGSARIAGWPHLADLAHEHESLIEQAPAEELRAAVDLARRELDGVSPARLASGTGPQEIIATGETRVSADAWENLLGWSTELVGVQARLATQIERLERATREFESASRRWHRLPFAQEFLDTQAARELLSDMDAVRHALSEAVGDVDSSHRLAARASRSLQQNLVRARLVRFHDTESRLQRVVADAATRMNVAAELILIGGDTALDGALCRRLLPAIEQLLRNAVVHGLAARSSRALSTTASPSPEAGRIELDVSVDGMTLVICVRDDGVGLPADKKHITDLEALGFSTVDTTDSSTVQLAGNGHGLASVRQIMDEVGGDVQLCAASRGACFQLRVPQIMPVQQVLLVAVDDRVFGVSVDHVRDIIAFDEAQPGINLNASIGLASAGPPLDEGTLAQRRSLVLLADGEEIVVSVDGVLGYRELVVQSLGPQLSSLGCYTAGADLGDGRTVLLIDPAACLRSPRTPVAATSPAPKGKLRILVADDSPTQREWAQQELTGWPAQVATVSNGREALERLDADHFDALLLDIDMPIVDGFAVLKRLAQSHRPLPVPVVVLTSRDSRRDREAALGLGASDVLAKPADVDELREAVMRAVKRSL